MADEANVWTTDAPKITEPETLAKLKQILQVESPLIVEHRFYRGARGSHCFITDDYDNFVEYLRTETRRGDKFHIWHLGKCCRGDNMLTVAKVPDADGKVPIGGPY